MLKRIAIFGVTAKQLKDARLPVGKDVDLAPLAANAPVPEGATAACADGDLHRAVHTALQLAARNEQLLLLIGEAIDCREAFRPGSSRRVMEHAGRFAAALKLTLEQRFTLERAALVRDIGKLHIPNDVLLKDTVLTYDEWELVRRHTHIGADMVKELDGLRDTEDIVRRHHECYDGDGYPDRLEGDAIPFLARVMKIVDCYCAMTSWRRYRESVATHKQAVAHLRNERGKHFDPDLVDVFIKAKIGKPEPIEG